MKCSLIFLFVLMLFSALAQDDYSRENDDRYPNDNVPEKKWHFGGGAGMNFGTYTQIMLAPQVAYSATEKILLGGGVTYIYNRVNYDQLYPGSGMGIYSSSIYGGSLFNEIMLFRNIFSHVEYEALNLDFYDLSVMDYQRTWFNSVYLGGGIRQQVGGSGFIQLILLYDVIEKSYYPFGSRLVPRVSIYF